MSLSRLLRSLAWKAFPWAGAQIKTTNKVRVPLRAKGDFAALEEIFVNQAYAPLFAALPKPITSWVDLGCNAGMFSAWLYDRAVTAGRGEECRALLVEPGSVIQNARDFVRLNQLENRFQVVQACVGDGAPITFHESKSSIRSSSAIPPTSREKKIEMITCTATSLLDQHLPQADLIKIDIEGAEKFVLREAGILPRFRMGILEWHADTTSGAEAAAWVTSGGGRIVHATAQDGSTGDLFEARVGMLAWVR